MNRTMAKKISRLAEKTSKFQTAYHYSGRTAICSPSCHRGVYLRLKKEYLEKYRSGNRLAKEES